MRPALRPALVMALLVTALPLQAQQVTLGAGYALADYREQAGFLRFRGGGPGATLALERGGFALRLDAMRLALDPAGDAAETLESFSADHWSVRASARVVSVLGVEAGYLRRSVEPSRAAQSYGVMALGFRLAYPLAPGADVALRSSYLAGSDFSGGGSAPFGIGLGLTASFGPGSGRVRLTGDYEFERIDRRTGQGAQRQSVPIQSSIARLGAAVRF